MQHVDWDAVEELVKPYFSDEPLNNWDTACRIVRHLSWLGRDFKDFDATRARLLCVFRCIEDVARDPRKRRAWLKPLRDAGVNLETQTWLWIALESNGATPTTLEEQAACDAAALETVGAIGVARAFTSGGRSGQSISQSIAVLRSTLDSVEFLTPPARRLGVRRIVYTRRFLKEMEEE